MPSAMTRKQRNHRDRRRNLKRSQIRKSPLLLGGELENPRVNGTETDGLNPAMDTSSQPQPAPPPREENPLYYPSDTGISSGTDRIDDPVRPFDQEPGTVTPTGGPEDFGPSEQDYYQAQYDYYLEMAEDYRNREREPSTHTIERQYYSSPQESYRSSPQPSYASYPDSQYSWVGGRYQPSMGYKREVEPAKRELPFPFSLLPPPLRLLIENILYGVK